MLLALTLAGTAVYLLAQARSPEILNDKDAADAIQGFHIAATICAPLGLLYLASAFGLWKHKRWGWWLAFPLNLGAFVMCVYGAIDDGWKGSDAADIAGL